MQKLKIIIFSFLIGLSLAGGVTFAAYSWSTGWITSGGTISAVELKNNLEYLKSVKVDKPPACTGGGKALQYNNGWDCVAITTPPPPAASCSAENVSGVGYCDAANHNEQCIVQAQTTSSGYGGYSTCSGTNINGIANCTDGQWLVVQTIHNRHCSRWSYGN